MLEVADLGCTCPDDEPAVSILDFDLLADKFRLEWTIQFAIDLILRLRPTLRVRRS